MRKKKLSQGALDTLIHTGVAAQRAGDKVTAEQCYRKALSQSPNHFDALQLMGALELQSGHYQVAIPLLEKAVGVAPALPVIRNNLGLAYRGAGQMAAAVEQFRLALAYAPSLWQARFNLGRGLLEMRHFQEAAELLGHAHEDNPSHIETTLGLVQALYETGRSARARYIVNDVLWSQPAAHETRVRLANLTKVYADYETAATVYVELLSRDTGEHGGASDLHADLADCYESLNRLSPALQHAENALAQDPDNFIANLVHIRVARRSGDLASATARLEPLLQQLSDNEEEAAAVAFHEHALLLQAMGRPREAMEARMKSKGILAALPMVQAMLTSTLPGYISHTKAWIEASFPAGGAKTEVPSALQERRLHPVFLVGFPRSGTTLIEQILGAHSKLATGDEYPFLSNVAAEAERLAGKPLPEALDFLDQRDVIRLRATYWRSVDQENGEELGGRHYVDKMPLNIIHLSLVAKIFPEAKVIVALRDPRDVCLSCYMQMFQLNEAMVHFLSLEGAAKLYSEVMDLYLVARDRLPLQFHSYRYEDLIQNFQGVVTDILKFLEIEWEPSLDRYYEAAARKSISTPSYDRVTRPPDATAIGRWREYAPWLDPVKPYLERFLSLFGYTLDYGSGVERDC